MNEGLRKDRAGDSLSKGGGATLGNTFTAGVWFMNVTVMADNSEAVAKNNGQMVYHRGHGAQCERRVSGRTGRKQLGHSDSRQKWQNQEITFRSARPQVAKVI